MENANLGKNIIFGIIFLIAAIFAGTKVFDMYKHQDEIPFQLNSITYTKALYDSMETDERKVLTGEIETLCVRKHFSDSMSCMDTGYWFANALANSGVDEDLAREWMPICKEACLAQLAPPVPAQVNEKVQKSYKQGQEYGGATKWFWEK